MVTNSVPLDEGWPKAAKVGDQWNIILCFAPAMQPKQ